MLHGGLRRGDYKVICQGRRRAGALLCVHEERGLHIRAKRYYLLIEIQEIERHQSQRVHHPYLAQYFIFIEHLENFD